MHTYVNSPGNTELQVPPVVFQPQRARIASEHIRQLTEEKLLIPGRTLSLMDTVGQGRVTPRFVGMLPLPRQEGKAEREIVREKAIPVLSPLEGLQYKNTL